MEGFSMTEYELFSALLGGEKKANLRPQFIRINPGFNGVASEDTTKTTVPVNFRVAIYGGFTTVTPGDVLVKITDDSINKPLTVDYVPLQVIAGLVTQAEPIRKFCPFVIDTKTALQLDFKNSPSAPVTGGILILCGVYDITQVPVS